MNVIKTNTLEVLINDEEVQYVIYSTQIPSNSEDFHTFEVYSDEEPVDALYSFAAKYGSVTDELYLQTLESMCEELECNRFEALVWSAPVYDEEGNFIVDFDVYEGEEPADVAYDLMLNFEILQQEDLEQLILEACEFVVCLRLEVPAWIETVNVNEGEEVTIAILDGDEPADVIFDSLTEYNSFITWEDRYQIFESVVEHGLEYTREYALVYTEDVIVDDHVIGTLDIYDDGEEPIDSLYEFIEKHGLEQYEDDLRENILSEVCSLLQCNRMKPVVWSDIISTDDDYDIGLLEILKDEEPVDAVDRFVAFYNLSIKFREVMLNAICKDLECTRHVPVVFRKAIHVDDTHYGDVEVYEQEEVVDAIIRFVRTCEHWIDSFTLKKYFFANVCGYPRLRCTRDRAVLFNETLSMEGNTTDLLIYEDEEPADKVMAVLNEASLDVSFLPSIMKRVCGIKIVVCNYMAPLIFGPQPISNDKGDHIGNIQIEMFEEPVDVLYKFYAKHDLFAEGWNLQFALDQICKVPHVKDHCHRRKAIQYINTDFKMGNKELGSLVIWEDEEVVDVLFNLYEKHKLSLSDYMEQVHTICGKEEVYCRRSRAKLVEIDDINSKNFAKFGNETCERRHVAWQYLSSTSENIIGNYMVKTLRGNDGLKELIEHPLFVLVLFAIVYCVTHFVFRIVIKQHKHSGGSKNTHCTFVCIYSLWASIFITSFLFAKCFEPMDEIDEAVFSFEGSLSPLLVLEGEEPPDAVMKWAKETNKDIHPLLREPIHFQLIDRLCALTTIFNCTRKRAHEILDLGFINYNGVRHNISFSNPNVDPTSIRDCRTPESLRKCLQESAMEVCNRLFPRYESCENDITQHMWDQFHVLEKKRFNSKNAYTLLRVEADASYAELFAVAARGIRKYKSNFPPLARVDNGTRTYYHHDPRFRVASAKAVAFYKVKDPESREWHDKPCTPYFNGALCGKTDKDGNLMIEV